VWVTVFPSLNRILQIPWVGRIVMPSDKDEIGMGKVMDGAGDLMRYCSIG
jgi:hypothetical protein